MALRAARPTPKLAWVVGIMALLTIAAGLSGLGDPIAQLALLLIPVAAIDLFALGRRPTVHVDRAASLRGSLRRALEVSVDVGPAAGLVEIALEWPFALGGPVKVVRPSRAGGERITWKVVPRRRGVFEVRGIWLRIASPLGLWAMRREIDAPCRVSIAPDLRGPADDIIGRELRGEGESVMIGVQQAGSELRGLRLFQSGDDPRHVDWKATARCGSPVVREWHPDRKRLVVLALDAGRLMRAEYDGESKFDAALRAMARMTLAAESRGDRVGVMVYADEVLRWVPPLSGGGQTERLLRYVGDLEPRAIESDLVSALPVLMSAVGRRSLVVVISDVMDRLSASTLTDGIGQLSQRHLAMVAMVRDPHLDEALARPVRRAYDAYRRAGADMVVRERTDALGLLRARGVVALDLSMRTLALEVVQGYLDTRWTGRW